MLTFFSGFVEPDKIETYIENRSKYTARGRGAVFSDAVKQMEDYISDPVVCYIESVFSN